MNEALLNDTKKKMEKSLATFQQELSKLRTGRASLAILDEVRVESYGQLMPLNQVATLGVPEPRLITIAPWDTSLIPSIEKAIEKAQIGVSPVNDGKMVRLPIPSLTEERRRELVKKIKQYAEESRVAVRHVRREALEAAKKSEKEGELTEDESKKLSHQIQTLTDDIVKRVDQAVSKKEAEIMQV